VSVNRKAKNSNDAAMTVVLVVPGPAGRRAALAAAVVAALLVALLPTVAQAHLEENTHARGLGGAELLVSPDGYPPQAPIFGLYSLPITVQGKGFVANAPAHIFQCTAGEVDLLGQCQAIGEAVTDMNGRFSSSAHVRDWPRKPVCRGVPSNPQCSVIAATFNPLTGEATSKAEHYICFNVPGNLDPNPHCTPNPGDNSGASTTTSTSTSTTTTIPPKRAKLSASPDGYPPGSALRPGAAVTVQGSDFVPSEVAHIFQCRAGEKKDLRQFCNLLGSAPTSSADAGSSGGEFTSTVVVPLGFI
jgi:hypothetical protein